MTAFYAKLPADLEFDAPEMIGTGGTFQEAMEDLKVKYNLWSIAHGHNIVPAGAVTPGDIFEWLASEGCVCWCGAPNEY